MLRIRRTWGASVVMAGLCLSLAAGGAAANSPPARQTLVFPAATTRPAGATASVECAVEYGPVVPVSALAFSPDGKTLAVGGYREVLVWDLVEAKLARRISAGPVSGAVRALTFVHDGKGLAVGDGLPGRSGGVKVFEVQTGRLTVTLAELKDVVCSLAVSPGGKLLAAGGADTVAYVWSLADGKAAATIRGHYGWVEAVAFSPDGKELATGGADGALLLWETGQWTRVADVRLPEAVHGAAFAPDGVLLAAAVGGPTEQAIHVARLDRGAGRGKLRTRAVPTDEGMPLAVAWSQRRNKLYAACSDKTVKALWPGGRAPSTSLGGHRDWVYAVAVSPDGAVLASGSADGTVRLWREADGKCLATLVQLAPGTDDWLIMTSAGHFAASSPDAVRWRAAGQTTRPADLTKRFNNPEAVRRILLARPNFSAGSR